MSTEYAKRVTPMGIPNTRLDDLPDLIDVQKKSFEWFLKEGLKEELLSFSPVKDYTGRLELHFLPNYTFDNAKYTVEEARIHDATYAKQLRVMVRLVNRDSGEIKEKEVYDLKHELIVSDSKAEATEKELKEALDKIKELEKEIVRLQTELKN